MSSSLMNYRIDRIQFIEDRPGQVVRHTGDWSKIHRVLGWKPLLSWKEGLQRTAAWYRPKSGTLVAAALHAPDPDYNRGGQGRLSLGSPF